MPAKRYSVYNNHRHRTAYTTKKCNIIKNPTVSDVSTKGIDVG